MPIRSLVTTFLGLAMVLALGACGDDALVGFVPQSPCPGGTVLPNGECDRGGTACGDGTCGEGEDEASCASDCSFAFCGDGDCSADESASSCALDCDPAMSDRRRLAELVSLLESTCEDSCTVDAVCDPEYGFGECYRACTWYNPYLDTAGLESGIECAQAFIDIESCLASLSCAELDDYYEGFEPPYPCHEEDAALEAPCWEAVDAAPDDDDVLVRVVDVTILGVYVGPGKVDQSQWDGFGSVPDGLWGRFLGLAGLSTPVAAVGGFFASLAAEFLAKPDTKGSIEINTGSGFGDRRTLAMRPDTFSPTWSVTYESLDLVEALRIRVTLVDEDVSNDDGMGTFELNYIDLILALIEDQVHTAYVGDQTANQVPWVILSVTERR